jgi:lantibiotic leader peptide-processing serine protease
VKRLLPAVLTGLVVSAGCSEPVQSPLTPETTRMSSSAYEVLEATGQHLVMFGARPPADFSATVEGLGGTVTWLHEESGLAAVDGLSTAAAERLGASRDVRLVIEDRVIPFEEPLAADAIEDAVVSADDPASTFFYPRQWHLRAIGADRAWAAGFLGSSAVSVAIIDTGIDYNHANLIGLVDLDRSVSFLPAEDEGVQELFPGAHPVADLNRHGTHVASTVSSTAANIAGVTSRTTLFGVKVCRGIGSGCPRSATLAAIMYAADQGADIINMSLGGVLSKGADRGDWLPLILRATNHAHRQGSLIVVSAGNDALDLDHDGDSFKLYCNASNVVCVSATGPTTRAGIDGPWNDFDQPATFTNYGRSSIDVAAPGGNTNNFVYAACSSFSLASTGCQASNRFTIGLRGTSMAAPHASGVAALIAAHVPGAKGNPAFIRNRLHQTADTFNSGNDPFFGRGRVNAATAVGLE